MNSSNKGISIALIVSIALIEGSVRSGSYTHMAVSLVEDQLRKTDILSLEVIKPATLNLPLPGLADPYGNAKHLQETVRSATGVIIATPEYHGSFSSVIKLVIENLGFPSVLAAKPMSLLGVAAGRIGAIKSLEHLRSVCSHVGAIVLPSLISIANVRTVFDEQGRCLDPAVESQIRRVATSLLDYIKGNICPRITLERMMREGFPLSDESDI